MPLICPRQSRKALQKPSLHSPWTILVPRPTELHLQMRILAGGRSAAAALLSCI